MSEHTVKIRNQHFDAPGLELDGSYIDTVVRCLACGNLQTAEGEAYPACLGPFAVYYFGRVETLDGKMLVEDDPRRDGGAR